DILWTMSLALLWILPAAVGMDLRPNCFWRRSFQAQKDYYRSGDVIIGGNLPLFITVVLQFLYEPPGYRFCDPVLSDKSQFPTSYQIDPQYPLQNAAIVQLILYFQWNWIGIVVPTTENIEHFLQMLTATLAQNDICIQFVKQVLPQISILNILTKSQIDVLWTILNSDAQVMHAFLRNVLFSNTAGEEVSFSESGMKYAGFDILNWVVFANMTILRQKVGWVDPEAPSAEGFSIDSDAIEKPKKFQTRSTLVATNVFLAQKGPFLIKQASCPRRLLSRNEEV
ncbi:hypothetical protein E2320_022123, partial [Naja naja]